jgi:hypothetical protein
MNRTLRNLSAAVLLALAPLAAAQTTEVPPPNAGQALVAGRIAGYFTNLTGSRENSLALVNALRTGTSTTLVTTTPGVDGAPPTITETAFTPPTKPMGWGNVRILLALAQDQLARLGVTNPTNEQLLAALNGGDVTVDGTTTTLRGVLQMRAEGMGMGQIAHVGGTKVGAVVSGLKKAPLTTTGEQATASTTAKSKGVTTAAGDSTTKVTGKPEKGVTTAAGTPGAQSSRGLTTAAGSANSHASRGLVTAGGAPASGGSANAQGHGRGLVTAAGGGAGNTAATNAGRGSGHGQGIVTGGGNSAGSVSTAHGSGRGGGNAGGNGNGNGQGRGGGRG